MNKNLKTLGLLVGLVAVVGLLYALSRLDPPPSMSPSPQHAFKLNISGELIGLANAEIPKVDEKGEPFRKDEKGIAKAINMVCMDCHGAPSLDLSGHACHQKSGRCIPEKHPPKNSCIKCHRPAPNTAVIAAPNNASAPTLAPDSTPPAAGGW